MSNSIPQTMQMVLISMPLLIILSVSAFIVAIAILWRRGKTVEALLILNSLMLYVIALILLLLLLK